MWFELRPRRTLAVGLPIAVVLAGVSLTVELLLGDAQRVVEALGVDREGSLPTWFSSAALLACAASLLSVAQQERELRPPDGSANALWRLLALVFVFLSLDESVSLHEEAIVPLRESVDPPAVAYFSWILIAVPLLVILLLVLIPFLRRLPRWTLVAFVASGACYVGGAVGMEMVGGVVATSGGEESRAYQLVVTFEELLEMVGIVLFLASVNEHRVRSSSSAEPPALPRPAGSDAAEDAPARLAG